MTFLYENDMRARGRRRAQIDGRNVSDVLESVASIRRPHFDIFLSQTIRDAEIVLGVYDLLTEKGYAVFCDWIAAPAIDRDEVSPANAEFVRKMMTISDTLLFLDTEQADQSLWMCWELGWFDGRKGHVAILPILLDNESRYRCREFLGLYPYIEVDEHGQLILKRPLIASPTGVTIIESPNTRRFDVWREHPTEEFRTRAFGAWR
jgi:hypothetical protein